MATDSTTSVTRAAGDFTRAYDGAFALVGNPAISIDDTIATPNI